MPELNRLLAAMFTLFASPWSVPKAAFVMLSACKEKKK